MQTPEWESVLERALELSMEWLRSLPTRPVAPGVGAAEIVERIGALPDGPSDAKEVVTALARAAEPGLTAMPSGRFYGWVIGGALPAALAADWLTSAWDQNASMAEGTPAAAAFEQVALSWVIDLLALPAQASGALVTGAQMANLVCLAAARTRVLASAGWDVDAEGLIGAPPLAILAGVERHATVDKALRILGLGHGRIRAVAADEQGRMRPDALASALATIDGPVIVCAQVGNVHGGAIDAMPALADVVDSWRAKHRADGAWLHVDGAYGLWARASTTRLALADGAERADSWAVDAHKWLNTPYDCGIALTAHPEAHRRAMSTRAPYLAHEAGATVRSPVDYSPELSRRARGFALWAALRQLGRSGLADLVDRTCALAGRFAEKLATLDGAQVMNEVVLNQLVVRFDPDSRTHDLVRRVQAEGVCYPTPTTWRGHPAMRISISNWSTDEFDIDLSFESIARAHHP